MHYPKPDAGLVEEWTKVVGALYESSRADHCVLRVSHPTSLEVLTACPGDGSPLSIGEHSRRDGNNYCESLLRTGQSFYVHNADEDAHWDATLERRAGLSAYCGTPLLWPDNQAFGALELLGRSPFTPAEAELCLRLMDCLGAGINAQLELLFRSQQNYFESTHDRLTGLANNRLFGEQARQQLHSEEEGTSLGELWLLMWSIDDLPRLSSSLSAGEAESLLRAATEQARACIRDSDFIARLDENRFALLVSESNEFVATAVADRIRRSTRRIWLSATDHSSLDISCGITGHRPGDSLKSLLDRCDKALQSAQQYGGAQTITIAA